MMNEGTWVNFMVLVIYYHAMFYKVIGKAVVDSTYLENAKTGRSVDPSMIYGPKFFEVNSG
jgi:hypothetical protein